MRQNSAADAVPATTRAAGAVAADLEGRIGRAEWPVGGRLPGEQALAREYGTTRARVRTALAALARRGLVVSRPNSGWYVQADFRAQTVGELRPFSGWAAGHGLDFGGQVVRRERSGANAVEARRFGIGLGDPVLRFVRVRTLNGRPVMIERSTWAPWVEPVVDRLPDDVPSVFDGLADAGVRIALGGHRIEAVAASSEDVRLLGVRRSSPLLQVSRTGETAAGRVAELAVDRYLPEVVAFDVRPGDVNRTLLDPPH
ncbi:GntR family transcriptional regulator [Kitasatospora sp. NPDC049285]|uniref:GntR family transcriptional regulator n=1 Tax=Kitasatospora sp. NPDC049285 TaxID=3157096 RepID=UPI00341379A8